MKTSQIDLMEELKLTLVLILLAKQGQRFAYKRRLWSQEAMNWSVNNNTLSIFGGEVGLKEDTVVFG